jgi:hypothetical protein
MVQLCGRRELTSVQEFEELVQRNMAANCGMNYFSLTRFIGAIALRQIDRLTKDNFSDNLSTHPHTAQILDAFSLHRATLVLRELLLELRTAFKLTPEVAPEAGGTPPGPELATVDIPGLGTRLENEHRAEGLVDLLAVLISGAERTLEHGQERIRNESNL